MTDTIGVTTYTYDDLNRLTQVAAPNGTVGYGYDLFGNRTSLTYPGAQTVTYAYDLANRLTTVTDHASRVTQYTYDAANRQTGIQYPNGVQAAYTYDTADRLLSLVHTHPVNGTIASATYTLDAVGNRLSMQDLDGTTSYTLRQSLPPDAGDLPRRRAGHLRLRPDGQPHVTDQHRQRRDDLHLRRRRPAVSTAGRDDLHLGRQRPHDRQGQRHLHL